MCSRSLLITAVLISFHLSVMGQSEFGIKAGVNLSNMKHSSGYGGTGETKNSFHLTGGVYYFLGLSKHSGLQTELAYLGGGYNSASLGDLRLDYLNLPVLYAFKANEVFTITAGVYGSYLLGGKQQDTKIDEKGYAEMDFGLVVGSETRVSKTISAGLRYQLGLVNIKNATFPTPNRGLQIYAAYRLFGN